MRAVSCLAVLPRDPNVGPAASHIIAKSRRSSRVSVVGFNTISIQPGSRGINCGEDEPARGFADLWCISTVQATDRSAPDCGAFLCAADRYAAAWSRSLLAH